MCLMTFPLGRPASQVTDRNFENLSGGELQRFAIAAVAIQEANVYMIDEPSSYLDVRQRLTSAKVGGWASGWASIFLLTGKMRTSDGGKEASEGYQRQ